jgi:hypothetical protein
MRSLKWNTCAKHIYIFRVYAISSQAAFFINRNCFYSHEGCTVDQYESNDHKLSTILMNRYCDIAIQSTTVTAPFNALTDWERLVARGTACSCASSRNYLSHERFTEMVLNLWSLDSYRSALYFSRYLKNQVLFLNKWAWPWYLAKNWCKQCVSCSVCLPWNIAGLQLFLMHWKIKRLLKVIMLIGSSCIMP